MYSSCLAKQNALKELFNPCHTPEERYRKLIELGKSQSSLPEELKTTDKLVPGCQSRVYLHSYQIDGKIYFEAESDAIISAGLAMLLIKVYSGETAEVLLKCPPTFIDELGINASLTPSRAGGLHSIHLRMKQEALKYLCINL